MCEVHYVFHYILNEIGQFIMVKMANRLLDMHQLLWTSEFINN